MTRKERLALAQKRLVSVLRAQIVATERTLEQKIADAGPTNQRIEPFILTQARREMVERGRIAVVQRGKTPWYCLPETGQEAASKRLEELEPIYLRTQDGEFVARVGQALEIAVLKALGRTGYGFLGGYSDLDEHDDDRQYKRIEPPLMVNGKRMEKGPLDYVAFPAGHTVGIEVKNYRTWLYPDSHQIRELLWKCSDIDAIPVLVARRVPFITFRLLNLSGGIVHQNFKQLYPVADGDLAALVREKRGLGYHDVTTGNEPDTRMERFTKQNLPEIVAEAKDTFERFREVHRAYGKGELAYYGWVKEILVGQGIWEDRGEDEWGHR